MKLNEAFEKRVSVRNYTEAPVKKEDIKQMLEAVQLAPSGKNRQNWHFVIVESQSIIEEIEAVIRKKNRILAEGIEDADKKRKFEKFLDFALIFKRAPVTVLVFASDYQSTALDEMQAVGLTEEAVQLERTAPGIQNVGAAMEHFCLAAADLGYGTCWMTSPNYAAKEIQEALPIDLPGFHMVAMTPLGVPSQIGVRPKRKKIEEISSWI
jgi:nitroreductase